MSRLFTNKIADFAQNVNKTIMEENLAQKVLRFVFIAIFILAIAIVVSTTLKLI